MRILQAAQNASAEAILAGHAINSFDQAVVALAQNSIDAEADNIEIEFDAESLTCILRDNGCGISYADMLALGDWCGGHGDGSKMLARCLKGRKLLAIAKTSRLVLASRATSSFQTWQIAWDGSSSGIASLAPKQQCASGTTVTVSSFVSHCPVRRRQLLQPSSVSTAALVKNAVQALSIPHINITFVLRARDGRTLLNKPKGSPWRTLVSDLFADKHLWCSDQKADGFCEFLAIGRADSTGAVEGQQYLYINGRRCACPQIRDLIAEHRSLGAEGISRKRQNQGEPVWLLVLACPQNWLIPAGHDAGIPEVGISAPELLAAILSAIKRASGSEENQIVAKPAHAASTLPSAKDTQALHAEESSTRSDSSISFAARLSRPSLLQGRAGKTGQSTQQKCLAVPPGADEERKPRKAASGINQHHALHHMASNARLFTGRLGPDRMTAPAGHMAQDVGATSRAVLPLGVPSKPVEVREDSMKTAHPVQSLQSEEAYQRASSSKGKPPQSLAEILHVWENSSVAFTHGIPTIHDAHKVIDQHAADERVKLEQLQQALQRSMDSVNSSKSLQASPADVGMGWMPDTRLFGTSQCNLPVVLTPSEQLACTSWHELILQWGWRLSGPGQDSGLESKARVVSVPVICGKQLTVDDCKAYLHQLLETQGRNAVPGAVEKVLASFACRHAYMFGDSLEATQCQALLEQLKATQLWFQCAHGRPTGTLLTDLGSHKGIHRESRSRKTGCGIALPQLRLKLRQQIGLMQK